MIPFCPLVGITERAMKCANIFIVTFEDDPEVNAAKDSLKKRYSGRNVKEIVLSYQDNKVPCFLLPKEPESQPASGDKDIYDTGIYVIAHGTSGRGFSRDVLEPATRTAFVNWLLSLRDRKFRIRKLSFLPCCGVRVCPPEMTRLWEHEDEATLTYRTYTVLGAILQKEGGIFVQHMCQAISNLDTSLKLDGLMVAGYTSAVYVTESGSKRSSTRSGARYQMRPTLPVEPTEPTKAKDGTEFGKLKGQYEKDKLKYNKDMEGLQTYAENKIVYVLKRGGWAFGKLSDYTDRDEWKTALSIVESPLYQAGTKQTQS
jgi:hypothetical protein